MWVSIWLRQSVLDGCIEPAVAGKVLLPSPGLRAEGRKR